MAVAFVKRRTAPFEAWYCGLVLRAAVARPHEPELRRDIDDGPAASAAHGRNRRLRPEEHARGVDGHHAVPILECRLLDPGPAADAGVVHEDVQSAEAALGDLDGPLPVRLARDVELREDGLAALRLDLGFDAAALGFEHVADDDLSA